MKVFLSTLKDPDEMKQFDGLHTVDAFICILSSELLKLMSNVKFLLLFVDSLNSFFNSCTKSFRNETSDDNVSVSSFFFDLFSRLTGTFLRRGVRLDK